MAPANSVFSCHPQPAFFYSMFVTCPHHPSEHRPVFVAQGSATPFHVPIYPPCRSRRRLVVAYAPGMGGRRLPRRILVPSRRGLVRSAAAAIHLRRGSPEDRSGMEEQPLPPFRLFHAPRQREAARTQRPPTAHSRDAPSTHTARDLRVTFSRTTLFFLSSCHHRPLS